MTHVRARARRAIVAPIALIAAVGLTLSGCSAEPQAGATEKDSKKVTIAVHDSFPNKEFAAAASKATGYDIEVISAGDGGELTSKLVLTKGAPIADAFFGVDTIFASRVVDNDVVEAYAPKDLPQSAADYAFDNKGSLTPVDVGATCINIDTGWFKDHGVAEPQGYEDLTSSKYRDLTVLLDPTASSTGASFLIGTVSAFGEDGFVDYWKKLVDNGARVEQGWTEAYNGQFTQGGGDGTKPIVVSYSSSPAFTTSEDGTSTTTKALLDTCSNQVEYAGVLAGAANPKGAKAVLDYMVSGEFQKTIPDTMYMYPMDAEVELPANWAQFAPMPTQDQLHDLPSDKIEQGREGWLRKLSDQIGL
ncbi:thiamine ABC transporter substrate-binding protein [Leucobacter coleopterorum]|uniref:Thiamine ABC transporter substrate-binding protein n=1 Tax=Leucobacter coleopterorum TaxID=2714933 RepID=A0ABX6JZF7_9MICO|nr:thiamine ABC transporter substrate-binding protein [Leucobacter coleopterorum]QIM18209.1 thiamine ABC transporter substrate-binding protein [Leucobacter coleopterorum]